MCVVKTDLSFVYYVQKSWSVILLQTSEHKIWLDLRSLTLIANIIYGASGYDQTALTINE